MTTTTRVRGWTAMALLLAAAACRNGGAGDGDAVSADVAAPVAGPVDSIFTPEEALTRFRVGTDSVDALRGGAPSLEALVDAFTAAVASRDSAALAALALDRAEYAWIHFPSLRRLNQGRNLRPEVMWLLLEEDGKKGMIRVLRRLGGGEARLEGLRCEDEPQTDGALRYWHRCTMEVTAADGSSTRMQVFGSVVELGGTYKFVSYANDF